MFNMLNDSSQIRDCVEYKQQCYNLSTVVVVVVVVNF